ncbi:alkane 1-monooxygenase [Pararhodobacter zhoushanensis]|uniref:alkane 1-monooxygenase n=1 Tax=Pararhodobacter zhoushanensis TaxID=2479545 RepID=UPI000F8D62E5|nr:alkane 1-monooxygenase [Pararhodobacter zhoushanensis]
MQLIAYAIATLTPAVLLLLGALWGGWFIWAAPMSVGLLWLAMDRLPGPSEGGELPTGDGLLAVLGLVQLAYLPLALWALTGRLHGVDWVAGLIGFGLFFGQIGNPAAHELIHRSNRGLRRLGTAVYVALLFGHHVSAHRLVHHTHVATPADPNSARRGLGFWRFLPRAWIGSFRAGYAAEEALRRRGAGRRNPYTLYVGGAVLLMLAALAVFGVRGPLVYVLLCAHAQSQLLVSDYVQHYGLRRAQRPDGRFEPVGPAHSWNAAGWYSAAVTLNAPRHSDHHAHPARPYPQLEMPAGAAMLPAPLPAMALVALVPPLWRRVMNPRLEAVQRLAAS